MLVLGTNTHNCTLWIGNVRWLFDIHFSFLLLLQAKLPASEIAAAIDEFRNRHLSELTEVHLHWRVQYMGVLFYVDKH